MKLKVITSKNFSRDVKKLKKKHFDLKKLFEVIDLLANDKALPAKYKAHVLKGNFQGLCELHIESNWLLVYQINDDELTLFLMRTGSHDQLFK